jgi:hypothetical protein
MTCCLPTLVVWFLVLTACLLQPAARVSAQDGDVSTNPGLEKACRVQLNRIYGAITEYRNQHGNSPPDKLSDLAPDHLPSKALVCPYVRGRGGLRTWTKQFRELSPDAFTSYSYEFPPVPLHHYEWRGVPAKTRRDWKEQQSKEAGPIVPIVRCHDHRPFLNLAVGGTIYETSTIIWETNFVEDEDLLSAKRLFRPSIPPRSPAPADFPPRPPQADPRLLDLTAYYNATLTNAWQGFSGNDLADLPTGLQRLGTVDFDVRGVIQLRCSHVPVEFPAEVSDIKVRQKCARIHFLHAGSIFYPAGTVVANYRIHYADGEVEEFPVLAEEHISDWWRDLRNDKTSRTPKVVWTGENAATRAFNVGLALYHTEWENPRNDTEIASITLAAGFKTRFAGPFVVAITLE